jgi:hypothetical protein
MDEGHIFSGGTAARTVNNQTYRHYCRNLQDFNDGDYDGRQVDGYKTSSFVGAVKDTHAIYNVLMDNTFDENSISIPFPQNDIHIVSQ